MRDEGLGELVNKTTPALLVVLSLASPLAGQVVARVDARYRAGIDSGRAWVAAFRTAGRIPGVSVAVGVNGEIVWSEGFGQADLEQGVPVTPATRFRIGSISKSLTAAAIGQLYEQGKLDLDAEVQRYVPSFPRKRWPLTVRQVAGHIGGIRHYRGDENLSARRYRSVLEGLDIFDDDTLLFEPGTSYSYSSYGWNLLSAVVEAASGQDFLTYMRRNVFEPLRLNTTGPDYTDSIVPQRTRFYWVTSGGEVINAPSVDNSYKWAGGGFLSTPEDLLRFSFALLEPGFLKPETVTLLWTSQRLRSGRETGYGVGWRSDRDGLGHRVVSHSGGSVGGTSLLLIHPESRVVVAIVANVSNAAYRGLPGRIAEAFSSVDR